MSGRRLFTHREIPALLGMGVLGHTWCAITPAEGHWTGFDTPWRPSTQANSGSGCVRLTEGWQFDQATREWLQPDAPTVGARYFTRQGNKWREVRREAAILDGDGR